MTTATHNTVDSVTQVVIARASHNRWDIYTLGTGVVLHTCTTIQAARDVCGMFGYHIVIEKAFN